MSILVTNLFDSKNLNNYVHLQFKKLKKKKNKLKSSDILVKLNSSIKDKYNIIRSSNNELVIKLEKKKNIKDAHKDIQQELKKLLPNMDINLLFKIVDNSNEIIIKAKRLID